MEQIQENMEQNQSKKESKFYRNKLRGQPFHCICSKLNSEDKGAIQVKDF